MAIKEDQYIELERAFRELGEAENDQAEYLALLRISNNKNWADLLDQRRVIILSEAGSGKTEEIRNAARQLIADGKNAFFLRLEYVARELDDLAFEEGELATFQAWLESDDEAWLFLDSVDEARLRDPRDFESAIRRISRRVASARNRLHVVISGRASAWRPKSDLLLCERELPFAPLKDEQDEEAAGDSSGNNESKANPESGSPFKVFALNDLDRCQIEKFLAARDVSNADGFLDAVERADAWSFTTRPQDLEELIGFWRQHKKIGSRREIIQASVDRRLAERDQTRDDAKPISLQRLMDAVCLLAGASVLTGEPNIQVPDGQLYQSGISSREVLPDWDADDISTLLARPIFDETIYGMVRFHHRSVREYLAALWFNGMLATGKSRYAIEQLFFRTQYGLEVVTLRLRPILPWLALIDQKILKRIEKVEPEVLFEGGDPSQLPFETRRRLLRAVCCRLSENLSSHSVKDYAAVQRFAADDLTEVVKDLIEQHQDHPEVLSFLVRMIWQGELKDAAPEALSIAINPSSEKYLRIAAFRAVEAVGSVAEKKRVRSTFAEEDAPLRRDWLAELLSSAPTNDEAIAWLDQCLRRVGDANPHRVDGLTDAVAEFASRAGLEQLPDFLTRLAALLGEPPYLDRRFCKVSTQYAWLIEPVAIALNRLVAEQSACVLNQPILRLFRKVVTGRTYEAGGLRDIKGDLSKAVPEWTALNDAIFWDDIEQERASDRKEGHRLTRFWQGGIFGSFTSFETKDFEWVTAMIGTRPFLDDKLVALSLAFDLYVRAGRKPADRRALWKAVHGTEELTTDLRTMMRPQADPSQRKHKQWEQNWQRRQRERERRDKEFHDKWRDTLGKDLKYLLEPGFDDPTAISTNQHYVYSLFSKLSADQNKYALSDWPALEPELGTEVARAFRDGTVAYWRKNTPKLVSEGASPSSTPLSSRFGMVGVTIEARETEGWATNLSESEAEITFRYAMEELNGFPYWLQEVFNHYPILITQLALKEIDHELGRAKIGEELHYLLYDISWSGDWLWNRLAPALLKRLRKEPENIQSLQKLLKIVNGSSVNPDEIARLAARKSRTLRRIDHLACWFSVWAGIEPEKALPEFEARLTGLGGEDQCELAMRFITHLVGSHHSAGLSVRHAFRAPAHLRGLIEMVHAVIRIEDDTDRVGKGCYSPTLRDDAQNARDHLTALLEDIPGKEAFAALEALSREHPHVSARSWYHLKARRKAQTDADSNTWLVSQVVDFHRNQERTPSNHRELFDLAVGRFNDLKADLEDGDSSTAKILAAVEEEVEIRKYLGGELRRSANGRFTIPQEEELADAKRIDLRLQGAGFDSPVPVELKLADNWRGPKLFERLENQLCGDYLRDRHSSMGLFVLVYRGKQANWQLPDGERVGFDELVERLQARGQELARTLPGVDVVKVMGIDLTARTR